MTDWQDRIVGARMSVDNSYAPAIDNSPFSRQEWGLIMTSVSFDIENPGDEEQARLVADTSNIRDIMPEVEKVSQMQGGVPGAAQQERSGGVLGSVKSALGLGESGGDDSPDEDKIRAAESLVEGYAEELQAHLEDEGRWEEVRAAYQES